MEQQKKRNRLISLAVCLLMLGTLMMPMNVKEASAVSSLENPKTAANGTVTWDCVYFGHYPQNHGYNVFDNASIKWRVLGVNGNEALLLADKNLDGGIPYNESYNSVTWETCTLRSWLNGYGISSNKEGIDYTKSNFIDRAFNSIEQNSILNKVVVNTNSSYSGKGGNNTYDKIFLLSIGEMTNPYYGFPADPEEYADSREAKNTAYAASKYDMREEGQVNAYWLRTSLGETNKYASFVTGFGDSGGDVALKAAVEVNRNSLGVRPAIRLNLASSTWSYAGTVSSDGTVSAGRTQSISARSFTKTYGNKPFNLGAKAKTKLSYKSSNTKVATVSSTGKVTLKGLGKTTITITAAATSQYKAATKKITITVKPKKVTGLKAKKGKKRMTVNWKRDKKATGYQITYAQNKKFKKGKKNITISKNKTVKRTIKKLKARKTYYVKVRAYKKVGKTKIYGAYSKAKKVKVR